LDAIAKRGSPTLIPNDVESATRVSWARHGSRLLAHPFLERLPASGECHTLTSHFGTLSDASSPSSISIYILPIHHHSSPNGPLLPLHPPPFPQMYDPSIVRTRGTRSEFVLCLWFLASQRKTSCARVHSRGLSHFFVDIMRISHMTKHSLQMHWTPSFYPYEGVRYQQQQQQAYFYQQQHLLQQQHRMASILDPHENDVLMGRGGKNNQHSGNEKLREMAREYCETYRSSSKKAKSNLSRLLVQQMQQLDPPARYVVVLRRTIIRQPVLTI